MIAASREARFSTARAYVAITGDAIGAGKAIGTFARFANIQAGAHKFLNSERVEKTRKLREGMDMFTCAAGMASGTALMRFVTAQPIATIDIRATTPTMKISITGRYNKLAGMVVQSGHGFHTVCATSPSGDYKTAVATIGAAKEGWPPGLYKIYAGAHSPDNDPMSVSLSVFDPEYVSPADAAAAPAGPLTLALGDDVTKPVSLAVKFLGSHPRSYPITLTSTRKRRVVVMALGGSEHAMLGVGDADGYGSSMLTYQNVAKENVDDQDKVYVKPDRPLTFNMR